MPDHDRPLLASRIAEALADADLTQGQAAERLGVSIRSVNGWCAGSATPRADALIEIARVTGKPLGFFAGNPGAFVARAESTADIQRAGSDESQSLREARAHYSDIQPARMEASEYADLDRAIRQVRATPYHTLIAVDEQLRYQRVEGDLGVLRLGGYDPGAVLGRRLTDVLSPDHAAVLVPLYKAALQGCVQTVQQSYGGIPFVGEFGPMRSPSGDLMGCVVCRPLVASYGERGMRTRSETPVLRLSGAWNGEVYLGLRASDALQVGVEAPA